VFIERVGKELVVHPPETMDFDATDIPGNVRDCMEEAIKCHSQRCWKATAIMVRRTLEEMCDERGATGGNLKERIDSLRGKIIIAEGLLQGAHELRFLGNDAAHIEAKIFNGIGPAEAEVGLLLAKELLRATYQSDALVKKLQALKKPPEGP
jgi:hypothetical protein